MIPLFVCSCYALLGFLHLSPQCAPPMQDFQLTDFERDITDNAAVGQLCDGCCLHAICASGQTHLLAPARVSEFALLAVQSWLV